MFKNLKQIISPRAGVQLVDSLKIFAVDQFKLWLDDIRATFSRAYILRIVFYHYQPFTQTATSPGLSDADLKFMRQDIRTMEVHNRQLNEVLCRKYCEKKASFVFDLTLDNGQQSCQLGAEVYSILKQNERSENTDLASAIAGHLRKKYNLFLWSVAVLDDFQNAELQLNPEHCSDLWLQRFGSKPQQGLLLFRHKRENLVMSNSLGSYGYFMCYRVRQRTAKTALVFWADKELADSSLKDSEQACRLVQAEWNRNVELRNESRQAVAGSIYRVLADLREMPGMSYIFGVGLHVTSEDGKDESENKVTVGRDLEKNGAGTFPLFLGSSTSCVLIWPKLTALVTPERFALSTSKLTPEPRGFLEKKSKIKIKNLIMRKKFAFFCKKSGKLKTKLRKKFEKFVNFEERN